MESMERLKHREVWQDFYRGRRVLVTGHTGFKGIWLVKMLSYLGAKVAGYALAPPTAEGARLYQALGIPSLLARDVRGDVRDMESLARAFETFQPEIVLHLAAQPIVRESYRDPVGTYATNVMGTVHLLECAHRTESVRSLLNVTTDKVYENKEWCWGYRENEPLDGYDPYSNSKSCSELVTHSYAKSFFTDGRCAISTARAGNVIGGGDFSPDRIVPDCIRATVAKRVIEVRNPYSTRPYQHVLEPLAAYLMIAAGQRQQPELAGCYNVGPEESDCVTTGELATLFCRAWGDGATWQTHTKDEHAPHEANFLKLDCSKLKATFHWHPRWHIAQAIQATVNWAKAWESGGDVGRMMEQQIQGFIGEDNG